MIEQTFDDNLLLINEHEITCSQKINEAFELNNLVIVLLDPNVSTDKNQKYKNLLAYNFKGQFVWHADLPESNMPDDAYWKIISREPLLAKSFSSYDCEIELLTGKILNINFYK